MTPSVPAAPLAPQLELLQHPTRRDVPRSARPAVAPLAPAPVIAPHRAPTPRRTVGARLLSLGALVSAAALAIGMSVPANALGTYELPGEAAASTLAAAVKIPGQEVAIEADVTDAVTARDGYTVKSWADVLRDRYGTRNYSYNVGTGAIRWPFPYAVPISSGYGERLAACRACSTNHKGIDFVPGNGAPIYAIADGVVIEHEPAHWSFGNSIVIQHNIGGRVVTSRYAHMQFGSTALKVGDKIAVGEFIGLVGSTGVTTAPHLHFEIVVDGAYVDPFIWLTQNAK